jgi:hypothetical protein
MGLNSYNNGSGFVFTILPCTEYPHSTIDSRMRLGLGAGGLLRVVVVLYFLLKKLRLVSVCALLLSSRVNTSPDGLVVEAAKGEEKRAPAHPDFIRPAITHRFHSGPPPAGGAVVVGSSGGGGGVARSVSGAVVGGKPEHSQCQKAWSSP